MKALLFSFFNAKNKHMKIYEKIYNDMNIKTDIVHTNILESVSYNGWKKIRKVNKNKYNNDYDIVHIMSGGVFPYYNIDKVNNIQPKYLIYDSGPFFPKSENVGQYVSSMLPEKMYPYSKNITKNAFDLLWMSEGYDQIKNLDDYNDFLTKHNNILLFNSKIDNVLIREDIEQFILDYNKKNSSGQIKEKLWNDSLHVNHYRKYKKEYIMEIDNFINS